MNVSPKEIHTDDFDHFSAWVTDLGFESELTQASRGRGKFQAGMTTIGDWTVWRYRASQDMLCEYTIPPDMIELCISRYSSPVLWCGQKFLGTSITIHRDRHLYRATLPRDGVGYGCLLPIEDAIRSGVISEQHLSRLGSVNHAFAPANESSAAYLMGRLSALFELPDALDQPGHAIDSLVCDWQPTMDASFSADVTGAKPTPEKALLDKAQDLIVSRMDRALTVGEIAEELSVTRRALERAFRHFIGVSPYQYLLLRRLHTARRMLTLGREDVLATSLQCGFEHASRFSKMYARQFGELPSQTKARCS
ncbi:MAG: helix-turn-helix domain-containing protein [Rubripirellula sp.]